ncbi:hypothetical protein [Pyramidobacter piscolens]|uniref:hypothetical protein n=1 Tax=Pyramidobacter piscolens TaxID=638849 RepID=UPI002AB1C5C4|nr:hypothetical protein [Pyramidobacter piscolens]
MPRATTRIASLKAAAKKRRQFDAREYLKIATADEITRRTGIEHEFEYMFAKPDRQWRSDVAWPDVKVGLEINGGIWQMGRHNHPAGYLKDLEKNNGYAVRGWLLFQGPWSWIEDGRLIPMIVQAINSRLQGAN